MDCPEAESSTAARTTRRNKKKKKKNINGKSWMPKLDSMIGKRISYLKHRMSGRPSRPSRMRR